MKRYKFIGSTEKGLGYIKGNVYDLRVHEPMTFERFVGPKPAA